MKQDKNTTRTETKTTAADVCRWAQTLFRLHERLAPRFARSEPHRRALAYACFPAPSGTPMAYVMICVPMCLSNWACSRLSWSSTKAAFPSEAKNRLVLACSIAEPLAGSRIVRSESFSRM